jgi:AAA domain
VRIAVSGSQSTGKTSLITAFLSREPEYAHEPEAYETLGDDVELVAPGVPSPEGLQALLDYTTSALATYERGARVIFERSPADYLAYAAAADDAWTSGAVEAFLTKAVPQARASLRNLDLIVFLPISSSGPIRGRPGEGTRYRRRVDEALGRLLLEDEHGLLEGASPSVVELGGNPDERVSQVVRLVARSPHVVK